MGEAFARDLEAAPPKIAKEWLEAQGQKPHEFVDGVPGQAPAVPPLPPAAPTGGGFAPAAGPIPAPGGRGGAPRRGIGSGSGGGVSPQPVAAAPNSGPAWAVGTGYSAATIAQVEALQARQGGHRDERSLLNGAPVSTKKAGGGGTNETFRVEFDNGMVGFFKPFEGVNTRIARGFGHAGVEQPIHEAAAWRLASEMGEPYSELVPPVVMREVGGKMGSVALSRPGMNMVHDPWHSPEWREAAFFDSLIGQQDRHAGNYLMAGDRLALIDHGYSFARPGDICNWSKLARERAATEPSLTYREREVLQRLLASPDTFGLHSMIGADRAAAVRDRAQRMLSLGHVLDAGTY